MNHPLIGKYLVWDYDSGTWCGGTVAHALPDGTLCVRESDDIEVLVSPHNPHVERMKLFNSEAAFETYRRGTDAGKRYPKAAA
jgi:hypothetical protein